MNERMNISIPLIQRKKKSCRGVEKLSVKEVVMTVKQYLRFVKHTEGQREILLIYERK